MCSQISIDEGGDALSGKNILFTRIEERLDLEGMIDVVG